MGALTLKPFPFELRGWELEKFNYIDLTDSFGSNIKISINNKKIVAIEPASNSASLNNWLNDKSRQFFDALTNESYKLKPLNNKSLLTTLKILYRTIYLLELCNFKKNVFINSFLVIYENLSNNLLYLLLIFVKKYSFIILKKSEIRKLKNNLQFNFVLNKSLSEKFFKHSSFCLLISSNLRFETSLLNLNIKQRILKGNFKCFFVGSFLNLTYNVNFLGKTTPYFLKKLSEGSHLVCQDLKNSKFPILLLNSELFKRNDALKIQTMLHSLNSLLKLNFLNLSIFETGNLYLKKPGILKSVDLRNCFSLYLINLTDYSNYHLNKIINLNLIYKLKTNFLLKKTVINQNLYDHLNFLDNFKFDYYLYMPTKTFFETPNMFINTQGFIKNTFNLILDNDKNCQSSWKIIRNILNNCNKKIKFINFKTQFNPKILIKSQIINLFSNFIYKTTNNITKNNLAGNLILFFINDSYFKTKRCKIVSSKIKFWLNDFFSNGKDNFSKNSLIMSKSSSLQRLEKSNFF